MKGSNLYVYISFSWEVILLLMIIHLASATYIDFAIRIFDWWHGCKAVIYTIHGISCTKIEPIHGGLNAWDCTIRDCWNVIRGKRRLHLTSSPWVTSEIDIASIALSVWCCGWILSAKWRYRILLVIIKHVSQYIFGILQSFSHLSVIAV